MAREKIHSYLGFARKSGNLLSGYNSCVHGIQRGKVFLVLLTEDLKDGTKEKLEGLAKSYEIPVRYYGNMEILGEMTGINGRGVFAVTDRNLASAIEKEASKNRSEVY